MKCKDLINKSVIWVVDDSYVRHFEVHRLNKRGIDCFMSEIQLNICQTNTDYGAVGGRFHELDRCPQLLVAT